MRLAPCTPVLARPDGRTQVGIANPLRIPGLSKEHEELVAAAETAALGADSIRALGEVGERLIATGALAQEEAPHEGIVAIRSGGRVGIELGAALAAVGVTVGFVDPRPSSDEPGLYPRRALVATCAGGAAWAVRERNPSAKVTDASDPVLIVQLSLGGAARHITAEWEHDCVPHLLIEMDDRGATVGPLVVPGVTACGRCLALTSADEDPAWPALLDQLASRQPRPAPRIIPDIVATSTRMLLAHLNGADPTNEGWRIELDAAPFRSPAQPHPDCGCGAWEEATTPTLRLLPDPPRDPEEPPAARAR